MTEPSHAVFVSYASEDQEAAQQICEALRAAGIEVFLDQSELRGGDAWDQKIRREIHDCVLLQGALTQLEAAVRSRDPLLEYLPTAPCIDPLRTEPRFQAIERELKFPH